MSVTIRSDQAEATLDQAGGAVTYRFLVKDRWRDVSYRAPWPFDYDGGLEGHLQGDFLCVPFGVPDLNADAAANYQHGYGADATWSVVSSSDRELVAEIPYPAASAIKACRRRVVCRDNRVEITDTIAARREVELPLGLHPIFSLPDEPGGMRLAAPASTAILTAPYRVDARSLLGDALSVEDLEHVRDLEGRTWDFTRLPLDAEIEELLQLVGVDDGRVELHDLGAGHTTTLTWDKRILPHCVLWVSNRGRQAEPWNGRNLCLGVEPVCAAFDLGVGPSLAGNPVRALGAPTSVQLHAEDPLVITHAIACAPAPADGGARNG
ncbi:hypothetical protein [Actinomyces ruminicola]|uniref:Galactose mutarotase n=1 Tax=Actinomyces ruminicola TaxID=332524 RepID=A0A1G9WX28_9ACTO|nr:hypothetical protein [Actinomyces ruminicola]SDM89052.1 hypothetical protein SAMN04487766_10882 [Actinomyces ruminicola]